MQVWDYRCVAAATQAPNTVTQSARQPVGLSEIGDDVWLMKYGPFVLGTLRGQAGLTKVTPRGFKKPHPQPQKAT